MPGNLYLQQQAAELVRRAVDEARYGNRVAAAALLRRAVQLDSQNELAWLWLGGVAAEPAEAAFALRAALQLNPDNQAARRGLAELEAGDRLDPRQAPAIPVRPVDSRWQRWRESRNAARSFGALLWALPVVLLAATIGLRFSLTNQTPVVAAPSPAARLLAKSVPQATPLPEPTVLPPAPTATVPIETPVPVPTSTPRGAVLAYLATLEEVRLPLRSATDAYLSSKERRTTAERAAATRALRDAIQRAREQLGAIKPPSEARAAHQLYLDGLTRETEALDDVLAFFAEYNLAHSNSAALRMQEARASIDAAGKQWTELAERYGIAPETAGE